MISLYQLIVPVGEFVFVDLQVLQVHEKQRLEPEAQHHDKIINSYISLGNRYLLNASVCSICEIMICPVILLGLF